MSYRERELKNPRIFRQGDILLVEVKEVPKNAQRSSNLVLARGEVTGHKHQLAGQVQVWRRPATVEPMDNGAIAFVSNLEEAKLVHEEHGTIQIPRGVWEVRRQREYQPERSRLIGD